VRNGELPGAAFIGGEGRGGARARRWAAGTPAAAIKPGGLGGRPFRERKGWRRLGAVTIGRSAHWRGGEEARGGERAPGNSAAGAARE
jgi:hypothetical protein